MKWIYNTKNEINNTYMYMYISLICDIIILILFMIMFQK